MSDLIFDLLKNIDSSFCEKIIQSKYTEGPSTEGPSNDSNVIDNGPSTEVPISYRGLVRCIICEYDTLYKNIPSPEQKIYLKKLVIDICSEIDEQSDVKYHNYK